MDNHIDKFSKKALLVIDMQNDALERFVPQGKEIIPSIKSLIDAFRAAQAPVIFLTLIYRASGVDVESFHKKIFQEQRFLVEGSFGAQVVDQLQPRTDDICVNKKSFSGFFQSDLFMVLQRLHVSSLVMTGIQTPIGIRATVNDALAYDYEVTVISDATVAQTPEIHQANLYDMYTMGACIKTVDELLSE